MSMRWKRVPSECGVSRNARRRSRKHAVPVVEPLDPRLMMSVTALFAGGTLFVTGDDAANDITISRTVGGTILVNGGDVSINGGVPTVSNTNHFHLVGAGGDDR